MRINGARQIGTSKVYQVDDAAAVAGQVDNQNPASPLGADVLTGTFLVEGPDNAIMVFETEAQAAAAADSTAPMSSDGFKTSF
ncbi:hypothetical protein HOC37_03805 [bacterium]|jgi:hypothetical protein|nr:hypothetical protein [bacterium]MBT3581361.1 hypothetical protein [bacterium]MBT4552094.1 hypothetical protein [bacterium]MBT7088375.1 hypothetical protein [bacterium]